MLHLHFLLHSCVLALDIVFFVHSFFSLLSSFSSSFVHIVSLASHNILYCSWLFRCLMRSLSLPLIQLMLWLHLSLSLQILLLLVNLVHFWLIQLCILFYWLYQFLFFIALQSFVLLQLWFYCTYVFLYQMLI